MKPTATDHLAHLDFTTHNAEVRTMWDAFNARRPTRIPIILGVNSRFFIFNQSANPQAILYKPYIENPDIMFRQQLEFARWSRFNLIQDGELGLPEEAWNVVPDFQNFYEAAWFGCPIQYFDDQVPDASAAYVDCPERVLEKGLPDPFAGLMGQAFEYMQHFQARAAREEFLGKPIRLAPGWSGPGTDGPVTVACNLFGADFVCESMLAQPERLDTLLDFITRATIQRLLAWRKRLGLPCPVKGFSFADDSVALISTATYVERVLPHHRALLDALATPDPRCIHLCGNATRHFKTLRDQLNIQTFDTGFPIDFANLRRELGSEVQIQGGPHIDLLLRGTVEQVQAETRRIMTSGVLQGGRFILREGNNLAPYTPLENVSAMYGVGRELGRLP